MAIIGKIRERSGLIVTFVGLGLLLFIIPVDKIWQQFTGDGSIGIGEFNNSEISSKDWNYEYRLAVAQDNTRRSLINQGKEGIISDEENDNILQTVWSQMISDTLHSIEINKLGIGVSNDEINNGLLNPEKPLNSSLKDLFIIDGVYKRDSFAMWKTNNIIPQLGTSKGKKMLKVQLEDPLKNERSRYKYLAMLKNGVVGTFEEASRKFTEENTIAKIRYVFKSYNDIEDSLAEASNDDLEKYWRNNSKAKWQQENEVRSYNYVVMNIYPSNMDKDKAFKALNSIKLDFYNSSNDSMFVVNNAETPVVIESEYGGPRPTGMYSNEPYKGGRFSASIDLQIDSANNGDVIGPFFSPQKDVVQLVKIYASGSQDEATVRHILIKTEGEAINNEKKKLADSIMYAVKRDTSKFSDLVTKYSDDPGSVSTGGVYKWFAKGQMVPEFNDFSFDKKIGSIGIVKTQFGYHIIEVLKRRNGVYKKIAIVDQSVKVSKQTQDLFYDSVALNFYNSAKEISFSKTAENMGLELKKSGYVPLIYPNRQSLGAYGPADLKRNINIAKWAFNNNSGSIMEPEYISSNELVIAQLDEVIHEEDVTFNNVRSIIKPLTKNRNKANLYILENSDKKISLDSAAILLNSEIKEAEVAYSYFNIENNNQKIAEPIIIANIFATKDGETSALIEGNDGIYMVEVIETTKAETPEDLSEKIKSETENYRSTVSDRYFYSLYKAYGVKDYRIKRNIIQQQ